MDENLENIENLDNTIQDILGISNEFVSKCISAAIILLVGLIAIKVLLHFTRKALKHSRLDAALHTFIINCEKVVCLIFLLVTVLANMGVPTTSFVTVIGACGAAVALALKDSLSNFAGGILIIINKPFSKGDFIESNGVSGKVMEIDLLYSKLATLDNKIISIPNGLLANQTIINYSEQRDRRIDCKFGIGYANDIEKAKAVIMEVINSSDYYLSEPEPVVGVAEHGDSAVIIDTLVWCETENYYPARYYLQEQVKLAFDKEGIEIPFQQVTVHYEDEQENQNHGN